MKKRELKPTVEQLNKARENGRGPTFHPLHRNRVVCNQVPEWGPLTKGQRQRIEHLCWPRHRKVGMLQPPAAKPLLGMVRSIDPRWWADREYSFRPTTRSIW